MLYPEKCNTCELYCDCEPWNDPEDYDYYDEDEPFICLKERIEEVKLLPGYN